MRKKRENLTEVEFVLMTQSDIFLLLSVHDPNLLVGQTLMCPKCILEAEPVTFNIQPRIFLNICVTYLIRM